MFTEKLITLIVKQFDNKHEHSYLLEDVKCLNKHKVHTRKPIEWTNLEPDKAVLAALKCISDILET